MTTLDIERIKEDTKRLREAKEREDKDRGYCILPRNTYAPKVSDTWALEVHRKYWPEIKPFLLDYASLILDAKALIAVGDSDKIREWAEVLSVAELCQDRYLRLQLHLVAGVYLAIAIDGKPHGGFNYANLAQLIARTCSHYPPSVHDGYKGDYDGDFDGYYATKREEVLEWKQTYCIEN